MKKTIVLLIAVTLTFSAFAQTGKDTMPESKSDTAMQVKYTCSMHPDVTSDKPGKCPKCGMGMVKKKMKMEAKKTYTCSMHPDVVSDKPGTCPKCGMKLVEKKTKNDKKMDMKKG